MSWFASDTSGVKADIKRHSAEEKNLNERISELEGKDDEVSVAFRNAYIGLRDSLLKSKGEVASKIGKHKS